MWHTLFLISFTLSNFHNYPSYTISNNVKSKKSVGLVVERSQQNSAPSKIFTIPSFEIIEDNSKRNIKRSVTVRLKSKVSKEVLSQIAKKIKNGNGNFYERTFILYYLPEMEIGAGAWATTHFNPTLKINVIGLTLKEEKRLKNSAKNSNRNEIGSWVTESLPGILTIYKKEMSYFLEWRFNDGSKLNRELIKKSSPRGIRFERKNKFRGEYYIVNNINNLESWDEMGLISTSKSISK